MKTVKTADYILILTQRELNTLHQAIQASIADDPDLALELEKVLDVHAT